MFDANDDEMNEESFADLFASSYKNQGKLKPGEQVQARILKISAEWVFLDIGQKGEGVLDRKEVIDADGEPTVKEGDTITAWFAGGTRGELRFTTKVGGAGAAGNAMLEDAWNAGIPVEGFVEKEVKGGFEVKISGSTRAFCPYSQISLRRVEQAADLIGKHLTFRITNYSENGRNIVLSRRVLLEEEARLEKEALKDTLKVGMTVNATVTNIRDFGAFVKAGAVEGLLPISEIGWSRVKDVSEVLHVGQEITVVVKQLDWDNEKFSFSLKDTLADPWGTVSARYPVGSFQNGTVSRLAQFGAFVTLGEGIDGLIHISRLGGGKKINHARDVLKEGQSVEVQIEGIDIDSKRISLALADIVKATKEAEEDLNSFRQQTEDAPKGMGTFADLLKTKFNK